MAERHLMRGIDNTCAAVREAVRRAKEEGIIHLRCPTEPIRGIDNATAVRHASDRSRSGTAQPAFLIRGIGNGGPVLISTNVLHEEGAKSGRMTVSKNDSAPRRSSRKDRSSFRSETA